MPRNPLPLGTWGEISTTVASRDARGRPIRFEAKARFRDFDGETRRVSAWATSRSAAKDKLRETLTTRVRSEGSAVLKSTDRVAAAIALHLAEVKAKVDDGRRAPGTLETYEYQSERNLVPRIGRLQLIEATVPRVNKVLVEIKDEVGVASAKTCKSILTGTFALAVRYGAVGQNPVREIEPLGKKRRTPAKALDADDRQQWFELLRQDDAAVRADLIDISKFMLATGERIGETLAVIWSGIDRRTGVVDCSHQIQRLRGQGLVRREVKTAAGERLLILPDWALEMVNARWTPKTPPDAPLFPASSGGFRDPHNVQSALRRARRPVGSRRRAELGKSLKTFRRSAGKTQNEVVAELGWLKNRISLIETGRVKVQPDEISALVKLYGISRADRAALFEAVELAGLPSLADDLAWVTSHKFRKTTATILDDGGQSARQIADQLGQADTTTTLNAYVGRKVLNPDAARILNEALKTIDDQDRQGPTGPAL
ncbi:helix-turn-helix domain-containing protein [Kribbella sp. NPDC051770]|uniref:helix-turn-helix domain-containing protein n=1 Tax=Kribbella sp. NPDC051770 TaxID=3155413 RepID=UPI00344AC62D